MLPILKNALKLTTVIATMLFLCEVSMLQAQTIDWVRQLGTNAYDESNDVSADGLGNIYISGYLNKNFDQINGESGGDAFVAKYTNDGTLAWTKQLGTSSRDESTGVSVDDSGNVYITGWTEGSLDGINAGERDAFIAKYTSTGSLAWIKQLGTSGRDQSHGVSTDGLGNVYISGETRGNLDGTNAGITDAFVTKYTSDGTLAWTRQLGSSSFDISRGVSADDLGNVYISGWTTLNLDGINTGSVHTFISKYTSDGAFAWTKQLGTDGNSTLSIDISTDGLGNTYISGETRGNLDGTNAGLTDAFISKYTSDGALAWTKQLGTSNNDSSYGISADGYGNIYISGETRGSLDETYTGRGDTFIAKYTSDGASSWTKQFGTGSDIGQGISTDGSGNIYLSGTTFGDFGGANAGNGDVFTMKVIDESFTRVPEPGTAVLTLLCLGGLLSVRRNRI